MHPLGLKSVQNRRFLMALGGFAKGTVMGQDRLPMGQSRDGAANSALDESALLETTGLSAVLSTWVWNRFLHH